MSSTERESDFEFLRPRLNSRFFVWSLAVAGSLSTTAMVALPTPVWAQEADAAAETTTQEEVVEDELTREKFNQLLRSNQTDELSEMIDNALAENPLDPNLVSMNTTLAMSQLRSSPEKAVARLEAQTERLLNEAKLAPALLSSLSTGATYVTQFDKDMDTDSKLALFDTVIERIISTSASSSLLQGPITLKSRLLISEDRAAEAKSMLDDMAAQFRTTVDEGDAAAFINFASSYHSNLSQAYPEAAEKVFAEAEQLAMQALEAADVKAADMGRLFNLKSSVVRGLTYSDPKTADEIVSELETTLEAVKERITDSESRQLSVYKRQIQMLRDRITPALEREKLIGTQAPDFQADAFVAMEGTSMDDLKGKVVLLDFWAVWCGPCIATFPHLIEWQEQYGDQGLVIIGATKYYNYDWDEETGKAKRITDGVEREAELAMLEQFRESYDLRHGFVVSGKDSDFSKQYKVSGIPQAVLIDQEGKIAMIRVGSGEANANALHAKIEELLAR